MANIVAMVSTVQEVWDGRSARSTYLVRRRTRRLPRR